MDKVFAVAGISKMDGVYKVRFAKDMSRVKVLEKNGHTYVRLIELPEAMDKAAAVAFLKAHKSFQDTVAQDTLAGEGKAAPAPKVKAAKPNIAQPTFVPKAEVAKTPAEIERIKAKNLATLRKVGKSWQEIRNTEGEQMLVEAMEHIDALSEAGVPNYRWARIDD